ncbi:hypothetical protein EDD16DRAFT_1469863 [Pisolithus croceorrhizus]|nr:hypothetical protein EV401DRAFT_1857402 [Pisolithus croceorrhizus]KAI6131064.1 hypothetical protein EDD16DRAFT_1469863 [Pisolithus croceorrhizus]KAI6160476.1 hypothetical protein EDD17DRAFT_1484140 [Pisolithus thermaeus]
MPLTKINKTAPQPLYHHQKPHYRVLSPYTMPVQPPTSASKNMRSILTTSITQAIDPTKDGMDADLLTLFLQQHGHTFTSPSDQELQRGIAVSPRKPSHGKDPKFIHGGLAKQAQHHLSSKWTNFTLWKHRIEKQVESMPTITSDMQLHILKIFQVIKTPEKPCSMPIVHSSLAVCHLAN